VVAGEGGSIMEPVLTKMQQEQLDSLKEIMEDWYRYAVKNDTMCPEDGDGCSITFEVYSATWETVRGSDTEERCLGIASKLTKTTVGL
jgi:hypothetical protein